MTTYHFFLYRVTWRQQLIPKQARVQPRMKALIASPYYSGVGGLQQYTYRIAVGLHNAGVDTTVITCSRVLDESGPRVFTLPRLTTVSNTPFSLRWFRSIRGLSTRLTLTW